MRNNRKRQKTQDRTPVNDNSSYIYGVLPVLESLRANKGRFRKILVSSSRSDSKTAEIESNAKAAGVPLVHVNRREIEDLLGDQVNHQGVVALVRNADLLDAKDIYDAALKKEFPLILLLDGIHDPGNLGAILRTSECAGVDGVVFSSHNSVGITDTVVKTSAGAVDSLSLAKVTNVVPEIEFLKQQGFWVIGAAGEGETSYSDWDFKQKTAIVLGSEGKGLRRLTAERCDVLVKIPMYGTITSLNVSVATGVVLFEAKRQKQE